MIAQKLKLGHNWDKKIVTKLKNSNCDKNQSQIVTKLKTHIVTELETRIVTTKIKQNSKTQIAT